MVPIEVDVPDRIQADAALRVRGHVAEMARDVAVRGFVQRDREQNRERVDGERLDELVDVDVHLLPREFYQTRFHGERRERALFLRAARAAHRR